jgi:hypothetical protein
VLVAQPSPFKRQSMIEVRLKIFPSFPGEIESWIEQPQGAEGFLGATVCQLGERDA